jgi:hypothetical protein
MGSNVADKIPKAGEAEGSETNIEIKIKTLDSQTYTLRVDKQVISYILKLVLREQYVYPRIDLFLFLFFIFFPPFSRAPNCVLSIFLLS